MGLKKLLTNLDNRKVSGITLKSKSIGYPNDNIDTPPLIGRVSWDLNDENANPTFLLGKDHNKGGLDGGGLRGGIATNINRRFVDNQRISAFLGDSIFQWPLNVNFPNDHTPTQNTLNSSATDPDTIAAESSGIDLTWRSPLGTTSAGQQFKWRQIGLQRMNPKINAPMEGLLGFSPANQRTYVPVSTKTAVRLAGVSQIKREGTTLGLFGNGYIDDKDFIEGGNKNRLIYLYDKNILTNPTEELGFFGKVGAFASKVMNFIGGKGEMLYDYNGGPNSVFGIGRTFIGRYTNTNPYGITNLYGKSRYFRGARDYDDFLDHMQLPDDTIDYLSYKYVDWATQSERDTSIGMGSHSNQRTPREIKYGEVDYDKYRIMKVLGDDSGQPGAFHYNGGDEDPIQGLNIYKTEEGSDWEKNLNRSWKDSFQDFIPFVFEVVDIDNPLASTKMVFRAYIDSITDDFSANHNSVKYSGRAEKFYTYNEFDRKINITFKIAASSRFDMEPLYRKLNYLVAQTAPNYKGTRMRTPYMKITVGDWFNRLPGVLSNISLNWSKDYPWEIKYDEGGQDKDMLRLPHVLDVSLSFLPIHKMRPENEYNAPFISIDHWLSYGIADFSNLEDYSPEKFEEQIENRPEDFNQYWDENDNIKKDPGEEYVNPDRKLYEKVMESQAHNIGPKVTKPYWTEYNFRDSWLTPTNTPEDLHWTQKLNKFKENLSSKGVGGTIKNAIKK